MSTRSILVFFFFVPKNLKIKLAAKSLIVGGGGGGWVVSIFFLGGVLENLKI